MSNREKSQEELADPFEAAARRCDREGDSEYGWGAALTPRKFRDKGPADGGRYRARVQDRVRVRAPGGTRIQ